MKNSLLISILAVFLTVNSYAQSNEIMTVEYTVHNPSGPGACDGAFVIDTIINGTPPYFYYYNTVAAPEWFTVNSTSIFNLCALYSVFEIYDADCNHVMIGFQPETVSGTQFGISYGLTFNNETSEGNCDGSVELSVSPPSTLFNFSVKSIFGSTYFNGNHVANPTVYPNICLNDSTGIRVESQSAFGNELYYAYNDLRIDSFGQFCNGFFIDKSLTPSSDTLACDGAVNITVIGGVPPFTYQYSNGATTEDLVNLCPGYYQLQVIDSYINGKSTEFVISDSANMYQMSVSSLPSDTLFNNPYENCDFNYSLPVDSVYLDSVYETTPNNFVAEFIVVQDTAEFLMIESFEMDSISNIMISYSFYCENRVMNGVYTVLAWLPLVDIIALNASSQPIRPIDISAKIYPNPVDDILTASFKLEKQSEVILSITDITGKLVSSKSLRANAGNNSIQMNVNGLSNGIYLVNYSVNGQKIQSLKIIKE